MQQEAYLCPVQQALPSDRFEAFEGHFVEVWHKAGHLRDDAGGVNAGNGVPTFIKQFSQLNLEDLFIFLLFLDEFYAGRHKVLEERAADNDKQVLDAQHFSGKQRSGDQTDCRKRLGNLDKWRRKREIVLHGVDDRQFVANIGEVRRGFEISEALF